MHHRLAFALPRLKLAMSQLLRCCPYCGSNEGRCASSATRRPVTECKSCGRVVEERRFEIEELFYERAKDSPLCIVTPDFGDNESYRTPPLEDDPFESIGFITAFSTWSLELSPLFTSTCNTFSGHLAELERVLLDPVHGDVASPGTGIVDALRAYFQIVEVSSILGLERDFCDHAIQLFRDCSSTTYLRNRNVEALATAALVQAIREAQEPRTLQEVSTAANIPQKEIAKYMKVLSDALKLSQPINSNSISVHMPRFCSLLQLSKTTQDLATHIGEVVINKSFCTRRNPISISAAAIYLSCQLEDKRKTQTEICKATGLTEVTLRKVYKELMENLNDLLPANYTPAVPPEKTFPVSGAALGRAYATKSSTIDSSYMSASAINLSDGINVMSSGGAASCSIHSSSASLVKLPMSFSTSNNIPSTNVRNSCSSTMDGRSSINPFSAPASGASAVAPVTIGVSVEASRNEDRIGISQNPREVKMESEQTNQKERENMEDEPLGVSKLPPFKGSNVDCQLDTGSTIGPSFLPFRPFIQDLANCPWPIQAFYGLPLQRPEGSASGFTIDRSSEDGLSQLGVNKSQFGGIMPASTGEGIASSGFSNVSTSMKSFQSPEYLLPSEGERQCLSQTHTEVVAGKERGHDAGNDAVGIPLPRRSLQASVTNKNHAIATTTNDMLFQSFPPQGLWGFRPAGPVPLGLFSPQLAAQYGGVLCGLPHKDSHNLGTDRGKTVAQTGDASSHTAVPSSEKSEAGGQVASSSALRQASFNSSQSGISQFPITAWPPPHFHHFFMSANNSGGILADGSTGCSTSLQLDAKHSEKISGPSLKRFSSGTGVDVATGPTSDMSSELSMGINPGAQPCHSEKQL